MPRQENQRRFQPANAVSAIKDQYSNLKNKGWNYAWRISAAASLFLASCTIPENTNQPETLPANTNESPETNTTTASELPESTETPITPPAPIVGLTEADFVNEFPDAHSFLMESMQKMDWISGKSVELSALIFSPADQAPEVVILADIDGFPHIALRRQQSEADQIQTQIEMSPLFVSADEQGNVLYFTTLEDEQGNPIANPFLKEITNSDGTQETWGYMTNGTIVKSPTDLSNPFTTRGKLASAIPMQNLIDLPKFDEALNTYTATNLEGSTVSWDGNEWQRLLPALPDWATTAIEVEQATATTINGTTLMLRAFRDSETADNTSESERILFVLNKETNQWRVPLPTVEQSYAKYVNPFKTKTFATRELDSYAPELFEIPSLEPEYLRHWLQEYSNEIINNNSVESAELSLKYSFCNELSGQFASTNTCLINLDPWIKPLFLKYDQYLIMTHKVKLPLSNSKYVQGTIHTSLDQITFQNKQTEYYPETKYTWLEGLEARFIDSEGNTKFLSPIIGEKQSFFSFPGEEMFRNILEINNPNFAKDLLNLLSSKEKEVEDQQRKIISEQMSETIIPSLYFIFSPEMLPPDKSDWTVAP